MSRRCCQCEEILGRDNYSKNQWGKGGDFSRCKDCVGNSNGITAARTSSHIKRTESSKQSKGSHDLCQLTDMMEQMKSMRLLLVHFVKSSFPLLICTIAVLGVSSFSVLVHVRYADINYQFGPPDQSARSWPIASLGINLLQPFERKTPLVVRNGYILQKKENRGLKSTWEEFIRAEY